MSPTTSRFCGNVTSASFPQDISPDRPMTVLLPLLLLVSAPPADTVDVLLLGGTVHDGKGGAPRRADLGIRGERIVFLGDAARAGDRKSTRLNSSHLVISYAVFCLKKKKQHPVGTAPARA